MNRRGVQVGLLAVAIFVINAAARFVTWKFDIVDESRQLTIGFVAVLAVALLLLCAAAWWAVGNPFSRLAADIAAAVGIGALLSLLVGPFAGGSTPFAGGVEMFVLQALMFVGVAAAGAMLGFLAVVALGKDWRGERLRRYEQSHLRRPRRPARG